MPFILASDTHLLVSYQQCISREDVIDMRIPMPVLVLNSIV